MFYVFTIALFTDNILHLHYNQIEHECEAISGKNDKIARNCLVSTLHCIVMQMSKVICEKGYLFLTRVRIEKKCTEMEVMQNHSIEMYPG